MKTDLDDITKAKLLTIVDRLGTTIETIREAQLDVEIAQEQLHDANHELHLFIESFVQGNMTAILESLPPGLLTILFGSDLDLNTIGPKIESILVYAGLHAVGAFISETEHDECDHDLSFLVVCDDGEPADDSHYDIISNIMTSETEANFKACNFKLANCVRPARVFKSINRITVATHG